MRALVSALLFVTAGDGVNDRDCYAPEGRWGCTQVAIILDGDTD